MLVVQFIKYIILSLWFSWYPFIRVIINNLKRKLFDGHISLIGYEPDFFNVLVNYKCKTLIIDGNIVFSLYALVIVLTDVKIIIIRTRFTVVSVISV